MRDADSVSVLLLYSVGRARRDAIDARARARDDEEFMVGARGPARAYMHMRPRSLEYLFVKPA